MDNVDWEGWGGCGRLVEVLFAKGGAADEAAFRFVFVVVVGGSAGGVRGWVWGVVGRGGPAVAGEAIVRGVKETAV